MSVDGTDLEACLKVMEVAVRNARAGQGPQLIVARLLRLCGHGEHDPADYVDPELKASPVGRDCLKVAEEELLRRKWSDSRTIADWRSEAAQNIEEAIATARREAGPDPSRADWCALSAKHLSDGYE